MDDNGIFARMMAEMGVKPGKKGSTRIDKEPTPTPAIQQKLEPEINEPNYEAPPIVDRDEDLFARAMGHLGVDEMDTDPRIDHYAPKSQRQPPAPPRDLGPSPDEEMFMNAMSELKAPPKKGEDVKRLEQERIRRSRLRKKQEIELGATLDLHGKRVSEALEELGQFVARCYAKGIHTVMIITGKGLHSNQGKSVLRPEVENWIKRKGKRLIRSYAEAPRAYGGRGAFVLYLRES